MTPQKYGYRAQGEVREIKPCIVCDDPNPEFSWTDLHGEGYCIRCGTPYGLKESGRPCHIAPKAIPVLREFWVEQETTNGLGQFLIAKDYPDQLAGRQRLYAWMDEHHPELADG